MPTSEVAKPQGHRQYRHKLGPRDHAITIRITQIKVALVMFQYFCARQSTVRIPTPMSKQSKQAATCPLRLRKQRQAHHDRQCPEFERAHRAARIGAQKLIQSQIRVFQLRPCREIVIPNRGIRL